MHGFSVPVVTGIPMVCILVGQDVDEVDDGAGAVLECLPSSMSPELR